ncbi:hypothetical protein [Stutzerimonas stutzeri]|uniref:hypothetical protein n=1 Tax=Stutzerimonas stutzeri TaxID=316 RepID=UPI0012D7A968|nr:hypothetical protein [Stutzerimonas stutzeri]
MKIKVLVAALIFSPLSFAADNSATIISSGQSIQAPDCSLLAEDVKIPLSNSVIAGYNCVVGAAGSINEIKVSACHTAGRQGARTIEVPCTNDQALVTASLPKCQDATKTTNRVTNSGAAIMLGSTAGGQVGPTPLNGAVCNNAGVTSRLQ